MVHEFHHADLDVLHEARVQAVEVLNDHVVHLGRHLHPGGPAAHHHKGEQLLLLLDGGVRKSRALKALRDLRTELLGVLNTLEEQAVLLHSRAAKGVVGAADRHHEDVVGHLEACLREARVLREAGNDALLLDVDLLADGFKVVGLANHKVPDGLDNGTLLARAGRDCGEERGVEEVVARRHHRDVVRFRNRLPHRLYVAHGSPA
mmetsp:Transcript_38228/g.108039  ORF Transcript_38228/g.108039 Transcript_38228/m.108039 type:complete len:205 (+) Transcript_38228:1026-1640(+)